MSIGYACKICGVSGYKLKSCMIKNASEEKLKEITIYNINILDKMIDYNIENNIKLFRISSDIIPFASHPVNKQEWQLENKNLLQSIGRKIKENNIRVSMHPGQYTVLNSLDSSIVEKAEADLNYHACFLDSLDVDVSNKIILHIGGVYKDKSKSIERFKENYSLLTQNVRDRLVIENDDKSYNIEDVLQISSALSIPVVFDNLHNKINQSNIGLSEYDIVKICSKTWSLKDGRQKIHYSQQDPSGKPGSHSQTISINEFIDFYNMIRPLNLDIMLEVKDKNLSAIKCMDAINIIETRL